MNKQDRELGMGSAISRRDFVNGATLTAGAALALSSGGAALAQGAAGATPANYPPLRNGFRGDYQGIYTPAHAMRDGGKAPEGASTGEVYDLVVVGGGLSGLGAAWYYREAAGPTAKILVLENHDDFGGHAKRNEFVIGGKMMIAPGGSNRLPSMDTWAYDSARLIKHLGIVQGDPRDKTDSDLYRSLGMGQATFFNKAAFGQDKLVKGGTLQRPTEAFMAEAPLPAALKADLWKLFTNPKTDYMAGMSLADKVAKLKSISYRDYLLQYVNISPEAVAYSNGAWALSPDTASAWFALFRHKPGFAGLGISPSETSPESHVREQTNYYLPGGNHSVCRLIIRDLIPDALPPGDFVEVETERLNYATLDRPGQATRIRLSSTVVRARHVGDQPKLFDSDGREVEVTYVTADGKALTVKAKDVIMAGNNNMIPYICPELPDAQKAAMRKLVRTINVQTNVVLRNWEAFQKLGVSRISFPRSFYDSISLSAPRSFGALKPSAAPSQPVIATFGISHGTANATFIQEIMGGATLPPGLPMRDQLRAVRAGLFNTPFERFERALRSQAAAALGAGGFDPKRDILAMTLNRWGHGYAMPVNTLFDDPNGVPAFLPAREKFGRIAIANSDASGVDTIETAFNEAARAVRDLERHESGRYGVI